MNKLINMKLSKDELKDTATEALPVKDTEANKPRYPYGLEISLEKESLEKLGINLDEVDIGDGLYLEAICKVTSKNESKSVSQYGDDREDKSLRIQLCDMAIEKHDEEERENEDGLSWDDDDQTANKKLKKQGYR